MTLCQPEYWSPPSKPQPSNFFCAPGTEVPSGRQKALIIPILWINEGCSCTKRNIIPKPEQLLCSSSEAHTFSAEGTSNNSKTRNMQESVSITTVTCNKWWLQNKTERYKKNKFKSYRYITHQYKFCSK